jgi:hypothetical protein
VDRGQAQSATTAGERQTAGNTFDQYFHEANTARGVIIAASGGIRSRFVNGGEEGGERNNSVTKKGLLLILTIKKFSFTYTVLLLIMLADYMWLGVGSAPLQRS